jgi:hypothetical protein
VDARLHGSIPADLRALYALGGNLDALGEPDGLSLLSPATAALEQVVLLEEAVEIEDLGVRRVEAGEEHALHHQPWTTGVNCVP